MLHILGPSPGVSEGVACSRARRSLKRVQDLRREGAFRMTAILMILAFIGVIAGLNLFEFGRLD
jgi:hypothetical protein